LWAFGFAVPAAFSFEKTGRFTVQVDPSYRKINIEKRGQREFSGATVIRHPYAPAGGGLGGSNLRHIFLLKD